MVEAERDEHVIVWADAYEALKRARGRDELAHLAVVEVGIAIDRKQKEPCELLVYFQLYGLAFEPGFAHSHTIARISAPSAKLARVRQNAQK